MMVGMREGCISAKILADSITAGGSRLVTWELTYPRMIHAEFMTHRAFSRNSASSRAIPAQKLRERVIQAPATHAQWGVNQAGMQAGGEIADVANARTWWEMGCQHMLHHHEMGERLGLHKQIVNRVIEPWMLITVIASATDHANFFHLRNHPAAEPNFQVLAKLMWTLFHESLPEEVPMGGWHLPMITAEDRATVYHLDLLRAISVGRCARVSYLTHDGKRDPEADVELHDRLAATASGGLDPMHASPFEHQAMAIGGRIRCGNFEGWRQYRKDFKREAGPDTRERCERCGCWGGAHVASCPARNL